MVNPNPKPKPKRKLRIVKLEDGSTKRSITTYYKFKKKYPNIAFIGKRTYIVTLGKQFEQAETIKEQEQIQRTEPLTKQINLYFKRTDYSDTDINFSEILVSTSSPNINTRGLMLVAGKYKQMYENQYSIKYEVGGYSEKPLNEFTDDKVHIQVIVNGKRRLFTE